MKFECTLQPVNPPVDATGRARTCVRTAHNKQTRALVYVNASVTARWKPSLSSVSTFPLRVDGHGLRRIFQQAELRAQLHIGRHANRLTRI